MRLFSLLFTLTLCLACTPQIPEDEVMSTVTFELEYPQGVAPASISMVFTCTNANTLEEYVQSSITSRTFTHDLRQGYYYLMVNGFVVTKEGVRVKLRAVVEGVTVLEPTQTCLVRLQKIS